MEYVKGSPYFCDNCEKIKSYPYLNKNINCEILIVGGGINGAIANYFLSQNHDVVLVEKYRLGHGCTPCATALLEYQLDDFAFDLKNELNENEIIAIYKMGLNSIEKIEDFIKKHGNNCEFYKRPSFLFSDKSVDVEKIKKEYDFRQTNGFDCKFFNEYTNPFSFEIKAGLYCENGGCELNPYLFTKQLIENSKNQNKIFENTNIDKVEKTINDNYIVSTNFGEIITCNKIIYATGFNWELIGKHNLCERFISYTIVTNPLPNFSWHNRALIQDTLDPYHYLRLLPDNRIIFGGEDTPFNEKPIDEKKPQKIYQTLYDKLIKLFPELENKIKIDYSFCGCFGSTDNNMGLIGTTNDENIFYLFSCGANGIINAIFGAEMIEDILCNKKNALENVFTPKRIKEE